MSALKKEKKKKPTQKKKNKQKTKTKKQQRHGFVPCQSIIFPLQKLAATRMII